MNHIPQVTKETPRQGVVKMKNISMKDFLTVTKKVEVQLVWAETPENEIEPRLGHENSEGGSRKIIKLLLNLVQVREGGEGHEDGEEEDAGAPLRAPLIG